MANRVILFNVIILGPYWDNFLPYQGHVLEISTIFLLLDTQNGNFFPSKVMHAK